MSDQHTQQPAGAFRPDYGSYNGPVYGEAGPGYSPPTAQFNEGAPWPANAYPPMQPGVSSPPPPAPRRRLPIPAPVLIGCVGALVIAVIAWVLTGGGSPSPSAPGSGPDGRGQLETLWAAGGTAGNKIESFTASWITPDTVVDARVDGLISYALSNGAQQWGWQAPSGDNTCAMSTSTAAGVGVIAYGDTTSGGAGEACDHLAGLDVTSGKVLWTVNLDPIQDSSYSHIAVTDPYIAIGGDTVAAVGQDQTVHVYDLHTGKQRWATADQVGDITAAICNPQGLQVIGQSVYELASCLSTSSDGGQQVEINTYPAEASTTPSPQKLKAPGSSANSTPELWASGNWLLLIDYSPTSAGQALAYDVGAGTTTPTTISLAPYSHDAFEGSTSGQLNPRGWAINDNTLYIEDQGNGVNVNGVAAIDLTTGKQQWNVDPDTTGSTIVDATASGVQVMMVHADQPGYELVTLAKSNGAASYGPATTDQRFMISAGNSTLYISGDYIVNLEIMTVGGTPGVVVLSGAR